MSAVNCGWLALLTVFCRLFSLSLSAEPMYTALVCEDSAPIRLRCAHDQVVLLQSVLWGRDDNVTCLVDPFVGNTACSSKKAKGVAQRLCNGQVSCTLAPNVDTFGDPCSDMHKFLRLSYKCAGLKANIFEHRELSILDEEKYIFGPRVVARQSYCPECPSAEDCASAQENVRLTDSNIVFIFLICLLFVTHVITFTVIIRWLVVRWKRTHPSLHKQAQGHMGLKATTARRLSQSNTGAPSAEHHHRMHFLAPTPLQHRKKNAEIPKPSMEHRYSVVIPMSDQRGPPQ